jgi:hypothetical protein
VLLLNHDPSPGNLSSIDLSLYPNVSGGVCSSLPDVNGDTEPLVLAGAQGVACIQSGHSKLYLFGLELGWPWDSRTCFASFFMSVQ